MLCGCFPFETRGRPVDAVLRDVNAADFTFDDPGAAASLSHPAPPSELHRPHLTAPPAPPPAGWSKLSPPALEMAPPFSATALCLAASP